MPHIVDFTDYRRQHKSIQPVQVTRSLDARHPNRTKYRIVGTRGIDVQEHIAGLVEELEQHGASFSSRFVGPYCIGHRCYVALGEIVVLTEEPI
jgi:hypothetical protein